LVVQQIATAIANTRTLEVERKRAEALAELNRAKSQFLVKINQELRTPINVVSFSADLLSRHIHQWAEEKNRSYLNLILFAVQQITEFLDEIPLYGKAQAATLKFNPTLLNLEQFCRDIVTQMQLPSDNQKSINFVTYGDCTTAYLDPILLHHILTNLLSNAIKYSPAASTVTFELYYQSRDIIFQIKDAGIGVPVGEQQKIFEPFYRGSNVDDNTLGTGLGLSIVKTLVDLHGAKIAMASEVGVGTTFTVKLPLIDA
ncbi:MAG: HAMP domain-containing histidine kinase, partial [Microcoleus sp. SIO2G3]|nr:HAMP domain-containing histidine kinase [Microcoleus sp. SIO2G3]